MMEFLSLHLRTFVPNFNLVLLLLYTISFILVENNNILKARGEPNYISDYCPSEPPLTPNSTYRDNLETLYSLLVANATATTTGFYQTSAGAEPTQIAYGLFLCRGDLSTDACSNCVFTATKEAAERCESMEGTFWLDQCMLRHSYRWNFTVLDQEFDYEIRKPENVTDPARFQRVLGETLDDLVKRASVGDQSGKKFAVGEANYSESEKLSGLAQCTPDLTPADCNYCLRDCIATFPTCCANARGANAQFLSCNCRYELNLLHNATTIAPPPAGKRKKATVLVAIIVPIGFSGLIFIVAGSCLIARKRKRKEKYDSIKKDRNKGDDDITMEHSLQCNLDIIQAATNNFSHENKIGEGGYGSVYKGILSNGQEIAVKRLSQDSGQGAAEFKNEVVVVAKLQHRNLVRLLGFCLEAEEKILIYELVPNKSLDYLLFDPQKSAKLDWSTRYKIIGGIARGMLYLHEDSRLRIIHRDLKASNILLDGDMNAKVSDFGMARIFGGDQTQGNTSRVVGTFGYMSPEYVIYGHFSVKSDTFSFGVLILEIISGKRNNSSFELSDCTNLPSYAWKLWREGRPLDLVDHILEESYCESEVTRCIHIGLLCVQDDPDARPSMATVILMLNSESVTLPVPQKPAFVGHSQTGWSKPNMTMDSDKSTSQSIPFSMNEVSVSELYPR